MSKRNISLFKVFTSDDAKERVGKVLDSGYLGQGPEVDAFEDDLRKVLSPSRYILTTNSATSAEHLAIHLLKKELDLKDGDEVLVSPLTCAATVWPILANGLKPVWLDTCQGTLNIDLIDLERKINARTKLIIFVHWGGYPVDLDAVSAIVRRAHNKYDHKIIVIEDCAHALGATYKGRPIGTHANINFFSFQAIKHITCGDGGALVLPNKELYERAKLVRWYGMSRTSRPDLRCLDDVAEWGFKFHMNDIAAAIGRANIAHLDEILKKRRENALYYHNALKNVNGVQLTQWPTGDRESAYWLFTLLVENRNDFERHMAFRGIHCNRVHDRVDKHSCVKEYSTFLPFLDNFIDKVCCIPVGEWVTKEDREYIVECIKAGW